MKRKIQLHRDAATRAIAARDAAKSDGGNLGEELRSVVFTDPKALVAALADIAVHAWKGEARLRASTEAGNADLKRIARHLESIATALGTLGISVKDHTGETYDYGLPLKVVASQPRPGISREIITETIRPSVYLKDHILQMGEVVIDIPAAEGEG